MLTWHFHQVWCHVYCNTWSLKNLCEWVICFSLLLREHNCRGHELSLTIAVQFWGYLLSLYSLSLSSVLYPLSVLFSLEFPWPLLQILWSLSCRVLSCPCLDVVLLRHQMLLLFLWFWFYIFLNELCFVVNFAPEQNQQLFLIFMK